MLMVEKLELCLHDFLNIKNYCFIRKKIIWSIYDIIFCFVL